MYSCFSSIRYVLIFPVAVTLTTRSNQTIYRPVALFKYRIFKTVIKMADSISIPAAAVDKAVYVAIAASKDDAALDLLAGITVHLLQIHPDLSEAEISTLLRTLWEDIMANNPDPELDLSPNDSIFMSRILVRLAPALFDDRLRTAAKQYTRAFFSSFRGGVDQLRQVAPIYSQIDRFADVEGFRKEIWETLYDMAQQKPEVAIAMNQGPIAEELGIHTSQSAATLLSNVPIEPLATFVSEHQSADGGLNTTLADLESELASISTMALNLTQEYANSLIELNHAEQKTRDKITLEKYNLVSHRVLQVEELSNAIALRANKDDRDEDEDEKSDLEKAIDKAEKIQKELDKSHKELKKAIKGGLGALEFLVKQADEEFAGDIKEFASITLKLLDATKTAADGVLGTAKFVGKLTGASAAALTGVGFVVAAFVLVSLAVQALGLFGKPGKTIQQVILEEIQKIKEQINELRNEMNRRFDRIDRQLNKMFNSILANFEKIDFQLGEIEGNVAEIQMGLYGLHADLQRLNQVIHTFFGVLDRDDQIEAVNGFLNFAVIHNGTPLSEVDFNTAENKFHKWGVIDAKNEILAGTNGRMFDDQSLFDELSFPLDFNINYLREMPSVRFGLSTLSGVRLANPSDWITASEAYSQLSEESPNLVAQINPSRVEDLVANGNGLTLALSNITDSQLFDALRDHYSVQFTGLRAAIDAFTQIFLTEHPDANLKGVDLWGDGEQEPELHFFNRAPSNTVEAFRARISRCDTGPIVGDDLPVERVFDWGDHADLTPYMIADILSESGFPQVSDGLKTLSACVIASWRLFSSVPTGLAGRVEQKYQLIIRLQINYDEEAVFTHRFDTDEEFRTLILESELSSFDPESEMDPYALLTEPKNLWNRLNDFSYRPTLLNPSLLAATKARVEHNLKLLQRELYSQIAKRFTEIGDPIQQSAERLSGSRLLWTSYVMAGFPLSIESNGILRAQALGDEGLLSGAATDSSAITFDNVQNIYTYFSIRPEDPPVENIIGDIQSLSDDRLEALHNTIIEIIKAIVAADQHEPPELFAPTLLRLSQIHS